MASVDPAEKTQAERIYAILGGKRAARVPKRTMLALHEAAERRLRVAVVDALEESLGVPRELLLETIALSARTLARRRQQGSLSVEESDRALRLARALALAEDALGGREEAVTWLKQPNRSLGGRMPLHLLRTDAGASMVTDVLGRLEHGVFG
jgi:putative toxin-antitoxin system antitoxin component (TIGR02293 family)